MPRSPRIHAPGAFYHVTLRGNHRQDIFVEKDDHRLLSELMAEVIALLGARVHAYCWMTNHLHMIMQVGARPLGAIMGRIASRYARKVQHRIPTTGHLFERRYHAVLVDADAYLLTLVRYVHLNPVRAGVVRTPLEYPWSSHCVYLGKRAEPWVTTDFALSLLHSRRLKAIAAYERFVSAAVGAPTVSPFHELNERDPRILGSDAFMASALNAEQQPRSGKTMAALIDETRNRFGVSLEDLRSDCRKNDLTRARAWLARQALIHRVASLSAVARELNRDESSLRYAVERYGQA